jgi:hypothetical protein
MRFASSTGTPLLSNVINISGYPGEDRTRLYHDANIITNVSNLSSNSGFIHHNVDTTGGESGSPIWQYNGSQRVVVGIHTLGLSTGLTSNRGVLLTSYIAETLELSGSDPRVPLLNELSLIEEPLPGTGGPTPTRTSTPTVTPTTIPGGGTMGGTNFGVSTTALGAVTESWTGGTAQQGYLNLRWDLTNNATVLLPNLGPNAVTYTDTAFAAPGGLYCYLLFPFDANGARRSDLICAFRHSRSAIGAPENFTLRLNQSGLPGNAQLSWNPPIGGGQTGFRVVGLGPNPPAPVDLGPGTTSISVPFNGSPICFRLEAIGRGISDVLCGFQGVATVS